MAEIGIVGLGKMGILHAGILNALPDCRVVAVCEKETMLRRVAKKLLPKISFYDNVADMVRQHDLTAVYVTTPIVSHVSIVEDLTDTGKKLGLFLEKPLAGNPQDARKIVEISSGRLSMIGFQKRFAPQFKRVKQLLEQGALGDLLFFKGYSFVSGTFSEGRGWRFEPGQGGSLLDLGAHLLDLVLWYFGDPTTVSAVERSFYSKEVEDFSHISFEYGKGLTGYVDVSWSIRGYRLPETRLEIHGRNGIIVVDDDNLKINIFNDIQNVVSQGAHSLRKPEFSTGVDYLLGDPEYCVEDKYFLGSIASGKKPEPSFEAGLKVNKLAAAAHASAKNRRAEMM